MYLYFVCICVCVCLCVYYHNVQALKCWSLGNDILQPVRENTAWTSVFKNCSCHSEVLRIVKYSVSVEEEMTGFI